MFDMTKFFLVFLSLSITLLSGCGGGGRYYSGGEQCEAGYNPIPASLEGVKDVQKISLKPEDNELFVGNYHYAGGEIFYFNKAEKFMIHAVESVRADGSMSSFTKCVRGARQGLPDMSVDVSGLTHLRVERNGKTTFDARRFGLVMQNLKIERIFRPDEEAGKYDSPSKVYEGKSTEFAFYRRSNAHYEVRSAITTDTEVVNLMIQLRQNEIPKDPPPPPPTSFPLAQ